MGGNALSVTTTRLPADSYAMTAGHVMVKLNTAFHGRRMAVIPSYTEKADFGDMDVLIEGGEGYDPAVASAALSATEMVRNGDCTSFGLTVKRGVFQVDLIKVPKDCFDFALRYFAMNDLGNLLGRIAHKAGFKLGHLGLLYPLRDKDRTDHVIAELVVTRNWDEALSLLGYDPAQYKRGLEGGFRKLEDIFGFVVSSKYCNKSIYLLENRNAISRVRDRKRKTYMGFLEWLRHTPDNAVPDYDWSDKNEVRREFLGKALDSSRPFHKSYLQSLDDWRVTQLCSDKFNGEIVRDISGLEGLKLGELIRNVRNSFESKAVMQEWILNADKTEIESLVQAMLAKPAGISFRVKS